MQHSEPIVIDSRIRATLLDVAALIALAELRSSFSPACLRAAVLNCVLLLECSANRAIYSMALPRKVADEIDRLPTIAKFDYFLFGTTGCHVDRGLRETQCAVEIIRLRDSIVHPKPKRAQILGDRGAKVRTVLWGSSDILGVSDNANQWDLDMAKRVADAALNFLAHFFIDWCGFSSGKTTALLLSFSQWTVHQGGTETVLLHQPELESLRKHIPRVFEFLDFSDRLPWPSPPSLTGGGTPELMG